MGHVHRLRPIKILLASRDPRFATVTGFLLRRAGMDVVRARRSNRLAELIERRAVGLAVLDADSFPGSRAELAGLNIPVLVVGERTDGTGFEGLSVLPKWGPFEHLLAELERLQTETERVRAEVGQHAAAGGRA